MKSFATNAHNTLADIHGVCKDKLLCDRCGNWHFRQQTCPAFGAECHKCGKKPFAKVCHTKSRPLHSVNVDHETTDLDMFIGANNNLPQWPRHWCPVQLYGISKQYFALCKAPLLKSTAKLTAFGGHRLHT